MFADPTARRPRAGWLRAVAVGVAATLAAHGVTATAQRAGAGEAEAGGLDFEDRPIRAVEYRGLRGVPEELVRNATLTRPGEGYQRGRIEQDIDQLTRLGRFGRVFARAQPNADGSVTVIYEFQELPLLSDVQVVGPEAFPINDLRSLVLLLPGDPIDPNLIDDARRRIIEKYHREGFFVADVSVDEDLLRDTGILVLRVREGPRVRVSRVEFRGNTVYPDRQLGAEIKTKPWFPVFRSGALDREQLELDDAAVRTFYRDRGYLEARVGSLPLLSDDQAKATVVFDVEEGPRYTVASVGFEGARLFSEEQLRQHVPLRAGATYNQAQLDEGVEAVRALYARLGYLDTRVQALPPEFQAEGHRVGVTLQVSEGVRARVGRVLLSGNGSTRDSVVLHLTRRIEPGRYYDQTGLDETRRRLQESGLFGEATVTVLGEAGDTYRDVLIEVRERQTGAVLFNAGVSSDSGVGGGISISQRNFDLFDWPNSTSEFLSGRSFYGGGQRFSLNLEPGNEVSRYAVSLTEPTLFDTDYSLSGSASYYTREFDDYDESRGALSLAVGRRFGDTWSANASARVQFIDISDIATDAPVDVFDVEGSSMLATVSATLTRNTTDSNIAPSRGSKTSVSLTRAGLLGDYDFTRIEGAYDRFWTISEDFLERKTILHWQVRAGYVLEDNEVPVFDRFYAGGHQTFRGFSFRGAGPRGIRNDTGTLGNDAVGGDWLFLTTLEYEFPIDPSGADVLRWVVFTDMGTVQQDFGFDDWRVSVGTGVRLKLPFLFGQAPFALDFAVPIQKEDGDDTRFLSFSLALPFG